jgi:hypothetical protein
MSRRLGIAALTMALACTGLVGLAAAPASADATHVVTVTPSTGLSDGQTVTVTGDGYVEAAIADWVVTMCSPAILDSFTLENAIGSCAVGQAPFTFVQADGNGHISTPLTLPKTFGTSNGTVTCGQAPNDCYILVAQLVPGSGFLGDAVPISFGQPVPTLRDCITTFLADHQHRPVVKLHRLLVCLWTAIANKPR